MDVSIEYTLKTANCIVKSANKLVSISYNSIDTVFQEYKYSGASSF